MALRDAIQVTRSLFARLVKAPGAGSSSYTAAAS